jgi:uncharacterized membrane protein YbhN (UPF0104 family)
MDKRQLAMKLLVTLLVFGVLFYFVSIEELVRAVSRISGAALSLCLAASLVAQVCGGARFRWLLLAYGAEPLPWVEAVRLQLVSLFYNTYVPGGVAGDLVRAVAVRRSFAAKGLTGALAVSFVERLIGFATVLLLAASVLIVRPIKGIGGVLAFSVLGILGTTGGIMAIAAGRRLSKYLPGRLGDLAARLPAIDDFGMLALSLLVSVFMHACVAAGFHAVMRSLTPSASLAESLVIVPLASTASYIPATIAGAGTRDAAFVFLYHQVGVSEADALAVSLSVLFCTFVVAALGGLANMFRSPAVADDAPR